MLCLLTALLLALTTSLPSGASVQYVPAGWTSTEPGYWLTEPDGRDLLAALKTYRNEAEAWEQAVRSMEAETEVFKTNIEVQLRVLEEKFDAERRIWKAEKNRTWLYVVGALGLGFVIGR